jgi:hypothetical protein
VIDLPNSATQKTAQFVLRLPQKTTHTFTV